MTFLRNTPIRLKLTLITMLSSGVALLLAMLATGAYEMRSIRLGMVDEMRTMARVLGDNSAAALSFGDPESAAQTLRTLSADDHFIAAFIYDREGMPFARFQGRTEGRVSPPPVESNTHRFTDDWLEIFQDGFTDDYLDIFHDISAGGETIGTVYLRRDLLELRERLVRYSLIGVGVMLAASLVALLLTRRLQRLVVEPVTHLAEVVREVTAARHYSCRAVKTGDDEIGRLIDGFNEMLNQIQHRDSALQSAQNDLESRVEERTAELASSLSLLNATLDSTADGILAVHFADAALRYNAKFTGMWGIPPEVAAQGHAALIAFNASQIRDPEQFVARIKEIHARPEEDAFDVLELKDGRSFERYIQAQRIDGKSVGLVINFRDITARRRAEGDLENTHKQLLETSRQAGMAEVATSVLHNVGNVLNSVNVSATLAAEGVRKSNVGDLARVVALLDQHAADVGAFIGRDPQGRKLPDFLRQLSAQLARERVSTLAELQSLRENIEHIKDIVAMQQNYAKVSGVTEVSQVADLVEDSLRMNEGSLSRHEVELRRDYGEVPSITVEKHKVLQILVNLIRNAKHACDDAGRTDKQITIRVSNGHESVRVAVIDNGVGIPPENLVRIFNHGFTTRKNGHGFGLHNAVLTAREMGGDLTVQSDGPGTGATFTLELPLATNGRK